MYTSQQKFHSGSCFWPTVFNLMISSLLILQLTIFGVLTLKRFIGAALLLPLPVLTIFVAVYAKKRFYTISYILPLNEYPGRGIENGKEGELSFGTVDLDGFVFKNAYQDPALVDGLF
jgi:hypothetical protein